MALYKRAYYYYYYRINLIIRLIHNDLSSRNFDHNVVNSTLLGLGIYDDLFTRDGKHQNGIGIRITWVSSFVLANN